LFSEKQPVVAVAGFTMIEDCTGRRGEAKGSLFSLENGIFGGEGDGQTYLFHVRFLSIHLANGAFLRTHQNN
jgi:hypothetical protein